MSTVKLSGLPELTTADNNDILLITDTDAVASKKITVGNLLSGVVLTETNDLTSAVTWANIPDANVPESAVTQHEAALSITEGQISDLGNDIVLDSDIGVTVLGYDSNLQSFVTTFTLPISDGTTGQALLTDGSGNISFGDVAVDKSADGGFAGSVYTAAQLIDGGSA